MNLINVFLDEFLGQSIGDGKSNVAEPALLIAELMILLADAAKKNRRITVGALSHGLFR